MARRASSGVNIKAVLIGVGILTLILGIGYFVLNRRDGFTAPELNFVEYEDSSRSLSGNQYQVSGTLIHRHVESSGQIVVLDLGDKTNSQPLPIIIPQDFQGVNLTPKASYLFLIEFNTSGVAVALEIKQL